ncbi:MAG: NADH-quinone oxidoreductase subunit N [Actinobacteria bacterium]|nr:NADH-quinone oxidoreductase subunit N [Actinomycetota bacterium]MBI3686534.1 NADH-quinone oxidoreductase subunit N [Actinomycetota bacterium]
MNGTGSVDYLALAPILAAAAGVVAVLVADLVLPLAHRVVVWWVGVAGAGAALAASLALALAGEHRTVFCTPAGTLPGGVPAGPSCSYVVDRFTTYLLVLLSAAAVIALLLAAATAPREVPAGEYTLLVLASLAGGLTLVGARDLITLVVGLETLTLPTYVLVALRRGDRRSTEAGVKFLLVSVTASAIMLLGMALVYGLTGSVYLDRIAVALAGRSELHDLPLVPAAMVLVLAGFGFKVTLVPFHWWAPDVYSGAPVPVAAYLATVSKAAGVGGLLLVILGAFGGYGVVWGPVLAVLAAASMTIGNLVALRQDDAVRLLAWSSVAHAGYLIAPLGVAGSAGGRAVLDVAVPATLGYLALYVTVNLGAFACVIAAGRTSIGGLRGLARSNPWLAGALAFFLIGLAGLPPGLAGLVAKVVIFRATLLGGLGWLAVVIAVNSVIGLAYYLRFAAALFRSQPEGAVERRPAAVTARVARPLAVAVGLVVVAAIVLGFAPEWVLGPASSATP